MLAAIPPRRTTRSSTRNDSDTLCSWSGRSCSANRPGKCIRWSVAIEPVTAIFMEASAGRGGWSAGVAQPTGRGTADAHAASAAWASGRKRDLVEGITTRAGALRVGVVDGEPLGVDPVGEVSQHRGLLSLLGLCCGHGNCSLGRVINDVTATLAGRCDIPYGGTSPAGRHLPVPEITYVTSGTTGRPGAGPGRTGPRRAGR